MSSRARQARRLATILINASGVHTRVQYDRIAHRYCVYWEGGPTAGVMQEIAAKNAAEVPLLNLQDLVWLRTEPLRPSWHRSAGSVRQRQPNTPNATREDRKSFPRPNSAPANRMRSGRVGSPVVPTELPGWAPRDIDLERPNAARVYDYLLGGACNFEVDRAFAHKVLELAPEAETILQHNRAFLGRAVRFCVEQGIRQFLDLGSGIPTVGNVHEIAQRLVPECRVVYVDNEPVAVAHSQLMLEKNDRAGVVLADLLHVDTVLGSAPVRQLIDFTRPVAVILASVLHFVPHHADPYRAVARYVEAMAPGSFLVLSHGVCTGLQRYQELRRLYDRSSTPAAVRTRDQIEAFLAGTEIVEPGVVATSQWRSDNYTVVRPGPDVIYAAVGRKR